MTAPTYERFVALLDQYDFVQIVGPGSDNGPALYAALFPATALPHAQTLTLGDLTQLRDPEATRFIAEWEDDLQARAQDSLHGALGLESAWPPRRPL